MTGCFRRVCVLFVVAILCAAVAGAQTAGVTLAGTVTDETGAALPGATVTATNPATGFTRSATTDGAGRYTVLGLNAGVYDVRVELQAFNSVVQRGQQFQVGQTITLDFRMKLGALSETVIVTSETPVVQTEASQLARVVRTEEVDALPSLNRNFTELASLSPGVSVAGNNVTIGNGPTVGTGFLVDGSSLQEPTVGGAAFQVVQDWIQEFSVLLGQFPAEFGAAQNGILNAVTRSGSNQLRGRASGYFQNDALNAKLWQATTKLPFSQQRINGQIGGPIQKDRTFYFVGYERNHSLTNVPVSIAPFFAGVVPGTSLSADGTAAVGSVAVEPVVHSVITKVDYHPNHSSTFTPRLLYVKTDNTANGSTTATNVPLTASRGTIDQLNDSYQLAWGWVASANALLDSRFAYRRLGTKTGCYAAETKGAPFIMTLTTLVNPALAFPSAGNVTLGCTGPWGERGEREFSVNEAYTRTTGGHTFKVGGMIMRATHFGYEQQNQAGQYTMGSAAFLNTAVAATYPTAYSLNYAPGSNPYWEIGGWQYAAFAQDTWRIGNNLTLNYGLRYDLETKLPSANAYIDAMRAPYNTSLNHINTQKNEIAPRFGFTWTPTESKRLAVRGGFGVFYDESHNGTLAGWAGQIGNPFAPGGLVMSVQNNSATLNPYCAGNTLCGAGVPAALNTALRQVLAFALATNTAPDFSARTVTLNGVTTTLPGLTLVPTPLSIGHIDQDIQTPYQRQETIGVQADLTHGFDVTADLKFIQGRDQYIKRNVNTNLQGGFIDPLYLSRFQLGNGGELDVKQLLAAFNYRSRRGHLATAAYALGWANSNSVANFANGAGVGGGATNPFDYSLDYGPTSNDVRHVLNLSGTLRLWGDVDFSPIFRLQSGANFSPTTTGRPSAAQGCLVYYSQCYAFNSSTGSTIGRGAYIGPWNASLNARLAKTFRLGAGRSIAGYLEGYNLTNRVNIIGFSTSIGNATGGVVGDLSAIVPNAAQTMRQIQIGARLEF